MEPYDNSFPEFLERAGIYSHLITDHLQYFRDGGSTYHTRYSSYEYFRGQSGDPWKANLAKSFEEVRHCFHPVQYGDMLGSDQYHNYINREFIKQDTDFPLRKCFDAGFEFLERNRKQDDWFLQIESFNPHEPFHVPPQFRESFPTEYNGPVFDWPPYDRLHESPLEVAEARAGYAASVLFCDQQLGKLLDYFDKHDLWGDTALVVTTDHGYLLGEHNWWAKNRMPCFNEIAHIPLFIHHPDHAGAAGERRDLLTQTIDLMPTFLELHGVAIPSEEVTGHSLVGSLAADLPIRQALIYGSFGGAINVTNGRHVLMKYPDDMLNISDLFQYTLMPTTLSWMFDPKELAGAELVAPFAFTKGARLLRIPVTAESRFNQMWGPNVYFDAETALYDIEADPGQEAPYRDDAVEAGLLDQIAQIMHKHDAPRELYGRIGLVAPEDAGPVILSNT